LNKHYNKIFFQGKSKSNNNRYFEGWYYKQVNKDSTFTISFIPGVSYNKIDPHCFIQCIICNEKKELSSHYFKYSIDQFEFSDSPFQVTIANSIFNEKSISVDLVDDKIKVSGNLEFNNLTALPRSLSNPNIMGILSYIPKMECNHHIISMKHDIIGEIKIDDKSIDLSQGIGYMEKDWGTSFPKEYVWLQCNHFERSDVNLALSVANIPFMGFSFKGFFCSLIIEDKEYRFATYNRSKLKINSAKDGYISLYFKKGKVELEVTGEIDNVQSLASPKNGVMSDSIKEGLAGRITVSLKDNSTGYNFVTKGNEAGIEIMLEV